MATPKDQTLLNVEDALYTIDFSTLVDGVVRAVVTPVYHQYLYADCRGTTAREAFIKAAGEVFDHWLATQTDGDA